MSGRRIALGLVTLVVIGWALVPLARGLILISRGSPGTPPQRAMLGQSVSFAASDAVRLAGTYFAAADAKAGIVLVHGFKNTRVDMFAHAEFLSAAGYAVLVYDSRGCGTSDGVFGVGATEDRDVIGAVSYLKSRGLSHIGVLGVSLGAGDALLAAELDPDIEAVIADSTWADERAQLGRMASLEVGPLKMPLLPYEPALVDALIGGRLEDARPRDAIARIAPRPALFIHSADDQNATTPLADARAMFDAAGQPKEMWIAPRGGHAGALGANRDEYERRVLDFLGRAFP